MANKKTNFDKVNETDDMALLYMTPSEVNAKDIAVLLQASAGIKAELWEEMNVLELELSTRNSVDFEPLDIHFSSPTDAAFIKNRNIHTIFAITLSEADFTLAKPYLEQIVERFFGFICADTEDFNPVYFGSNEKN